MSTTSGYAAANQAIALYQQGQLRLLNKGEGGNYKWGTSSDGATVLILSNVTKCFYAFHAPTVGFYRSVNPGATRITSASPRSVPEVDRLWLHPLIMSAIPAARELLSDQRATPADLSSQPTEEGEIEVDDASENEEPKEEPMSPLAPPAPETSRIQLPITVIDTREVRYREITKQVVLTQELLRNLMTTLEPDNVVFTVQSGRIEAKSVWPLDRLVDILRQHGEPIPEDGRVETVLHEGRAALRWKVCVLDEEAR